MTARAAARAAEPGGVRAALPFVLVAVLGVAHAVLYDFPFEDAFITYRYAENLARYAGLVYNPGEIVEGFTSFGWTILLAVASWLGLPTAGASRVLSLGFGVFLLWLTSRLARSWTTRRDAWCVVPALLVAANGTWAYYAMSGMETTLFVCLLYVGMLLATKADEARSMAWLAGVALAGAALVRPEGVGYFAAIVAAWALERRDRRAALRATAGFAAIFAPYFFWRWSHFGYLLPNTYYAKVSPSGALFWSGAAQLETYSTWYLLWLVPVALVVLVRGGGWTLGTRILTAMVVAAAVNIVVVGGDIFAFCRFLLPAIPACSIALFGAGALLADRTESRGRRTAIAALGFALVAYVLYAELGATRSLTARRPKPDRAHVLDIAAASEDYLLVGEWLRASFPPDTTIATNAAGIVPYVSRLRTIDMLGLNDVHIAHTAVAPGAGARGHEKHDGAYVLSRKPDVVLLGMPLLMKRPLMPGELESSVAAWFPFLPGDREIFQSPGFRAEYSPRGAEVAPGKFILVFVRRSTAMP